MENLTLQLRHLEITKGLGRFPGQQFNLQYQYLNSDNIPNFLFGLLRARPRIYRKFDTLNTFLNYEKGRFRNLDRDHTWQAMVHGDYYVTLIVMMSF